MSCFGNLFYLFAPQLHINPDLEEVNIPLSLGLLESTGTCGNLAVGRFVRVLAVVRILPCTGSHLLLIWVCGPLS